MNYLSSKCHITLSPFFAKVLVLEIESEELNKHGHVYMQHVYVAEVSVARKHDSYMYYANLNFAHRFV